LKSIYPKLYRASMDDSLFPKNSVHEPFCLCLIILLTNLSKYLMQYPELLILHNIFLITSIDDFYYRMVVIHTQAHEEELQAYKNRQRKSDPVLGLLLAPYILDYHKNY
jgi:hypothetical protein